MPDYTFCSTCGRVVWTRDVDEDGNCVEHRKTKDVKPKPKPGK